MNQGVDMVPGLTCIDGQSSTHNNAMNHSNVDIHRTLLALLVFQDQLKPDNMRSIHLYNNSRIYDDANEYNHEKMTCLNEKGSNQERSNGFLRIQQDFLLQGLVSSGQNSNNNNTEKFPVLLQLSQICSSSPSSSCASSTIELSTTDERGNLDDSLVTLGQSLTQHVAMLRHVQESEEEEKVKQYSDDVSHNRHPGRSRWQCVLQYCSDAPSHTSVDLPSLFPSQNPALRSCPSLAKDLQLVENIVNSLMISMKYEDKKIPSQSGNDPGYINGQGYSGEANNINIHGLMQSGDTTDYYSEINYIDVNNEEESLIHIPFDVGSGEIGLDEVLAAGGGEDEQSFQCFLDQNIWQEMEIPRSTSANMTEDQRFNTWKSSQLKHVVHPFLPSYSGPLNPDQTSITSSSLDDQILSDPSWDYPSLPMLPMLNSQIVPNYLQEDPLLHPQENTDLQDITQKGGKYVSEPCSSIFNDYEPAQDFSTVASSQRSPFDFDLLLDKSEFDSYFPLESAPDGMSRFYGGTDLGRELEMEGAMSVFSDESIGTGAPRMMSVLSEPPLTMFGLGGNVNVNGSHLTVANEAYVEHDQWSTRGRQETRSSRVTSASTTASKRNVDTHRSHRGSSERMTEITLTELSQYFNMPITQASKELKVGLTVLKKRCREFGIPRWPHRKMKSLDSLIHNIQDLAKSNGGKPSARVLNAVRELEEQKKKMEEMPGIELAERTKRLRQACFKASYKKRRQISQTFVLPDHSHDHMSSSVSSSSDLNCTSSSSYICQ